MHEHRDIDYPLLFAILGLVLFGAIMISSVSVYNSYRITKDFVKSGTLEAPNNWHFLIRNIIQIGIGIVAMIITIKIPYGWWKKHANVFAAIVIVMLIVVLFIGQKINGNQGWLQLPLIPFNLQPTEFLKFSLIISVAAFCAKYKGSLTSISEGFVPLCIIVAIPAALVVMQPDYGALLVILPIIFALYFIAGGNVRILGYVGLTGMCVVSLFYLAGSHTSPADRNKVSYIYDRINSFASPNIKAIKENTMHPQNRQALIAIGSGGFLGLGFTKSIQKHGYLAESQGDFIFSVITEELGYLGAISLIMLYCFIIYRGCMIALACQDDFGRFVAFGITMWIFWQMIINISVNMNIFPNTGLTLPFVSYGGSSLLVMLTASGLLLAISRDMAGASYTSRNIFHFLRRERISYPKKDYII